MNLLRVGDMARINSISAQTLRYYEKIGLLKPERIDPANGYRYYSIKQSARLDMIQHMKSLGMNLTEIQEQLKREDPAVIQDLLERQRQNLSRQIQQLQTTEKAVLREMENFRRYRSGPRDGTIILEYLPERTIYRYDGGINIYDYGIETYEYILRELKSHILLKKLPLVYFCNVGSILRKGRLEKREFVSTEIFLFVDTPFPETQRLETISAGTFLCIYCDSFHKERAYAEKLLRALEEQKGRIAGDYLCEVVAELPVFEQNERQMFIKLQIPVELQG
ncbi:DNA-binding transcriptional regulator, MerR family [Alkalispirochaeta americana]|uniref:DNA-binding transcriptional regulator, MerR family n=1 Tax=Alkalispirochaeta americana TaxID=159291 RepID=A0A1N6ULM2_9SPIO|nr:MerR family transcriptional regulator [Alkalispirochaeta americana]SIQ66216.1 DNA-binding transcriptional regulator, MerR family [Alkalispirochaeta americana]